MGGFMEPTETTDEAAARILKQLTGLDGVYMEQMRVFGEPTRDPIERTISIAYFAFIGIDQYQTGLSTDYHAEWFPLQNAPRLIFDHDAMIEKAKEMLRYKAALHPLLFELLPEKFTIPQIQLLYENVYGTVLDKRNFSRKLLSTGLIIRQDEKDKSSSKRGAYYYKLDPAIYKDKFQAFLNFIPNPHAFSM
jgi:ADP-ribose pyrophosphatase YjhB (NUDIX family)